MNPLIHHTPFPLTLELCNSVYYQGAKIVLYYKSNKKAGYYAAFCNTITRFYCHIFTPADYPAFLAPPLPAIN